MELDAVAQTRPTADDAKGTDLDPRAQRRAVLHKSRRVDDPSHYCAGIGAAPTEAMAVFGQHRAVFGLGAQFFADEGFAFEAPYRTAMALSTRTGMRSNAPG